MSSRNIFLYKSDNVSRFLLPARANERGNDQGMRFPSAGGRFKGMEIMPSTQEVFLHLLVSSQLIGSEREEVAFLLFQPPTRDLLSFPTLLLNFPVFGRTVETKLAKNILLRTLRLKRNVCQCVSCMDIVPFSSSYLGHRGSHSSRESHSISFPANLLQLLQENIITPLTMSEDVLHQVICSAPISILLQILPSGISAFIPFQHVL